MRKLIFIIAAGLAAYHLWTGRLLESYSYRSEVGYYTGERQDWYVGAERTTREACISDAAAYYNSLNFQSPGRAFSWACRKMQGERFLERVR